MRKLTYTLALMAAVALMPSCKKDNDDKQQVDQKVVRVGALLSLTGNWSTLGLTSQAAIDIALEDINQYMDQTGSANRFVAEVYDTKLEVSLAQQYAMQVKDKGCQFLIGPQSSAEAAAVMDIANGNNMVAVSQGSTAGVLSIEGDNLFRFCPDDHIEGQAMAKTIYNNGIRALITVARDDAGNKGLQTSTGAAFTALSGTVDATTPYSSTTTDFTALLAEIKAAIQLHKTTHTTSQIAVYLASFDECVALFQQASADPELSSVRWYGGDGTALSTALTANSTAADFAIATRYFAPAVGLPAQAASKWQPLSDKIKARTGITPDAFALAAYDALWVIALSYNAFPYTAPDFAKLRAEFVAQAGKYYGATGATMLNAAGDRAVGAYDYWGITKEGSSYKWAMVGKSE